MKLSNLILGTVLMIAILPASTVLAQQLPARRARVNNNAVPNRAPAAAATPVPYTPPAVAAGPVVEAGPRNSSFKWDLYIDVEGRLPSRDTLPDRGFTLNDAALYMTKDFGRGVRGLVELPFASDLTGKTGSVMFATSRAQAYLESDRSLPLYLKAGQYNTFLGVEANDSRDRFFADLGLIKGLLLPSTHTGLQVGYHTPAFSFNGQIADPNGSNNMSAANPEIGLNARFESGQAYGAGGLTVNDDKTTTTGSHTNMILDLTGGWGANRLKIDGEITWLKKAGSNKDGTAFGVFAVYGLDDALSFGGRLEYGRDITLPVTGAPPGTYDSIFALSAGPSYKFQPDLTLRGDLSIDNMKSPTFDDTIYTVSASMVASF